MPAEIGVPEMTPDELRVRPPGIPETWLHVYGPPPPPLAESWTGVGVRLGGMGGLTYATPIEPLGRLEVSIETAV